MDPNHYQPQPPAPQQPAPNPYDYILNTPQKQKKFRLGGGNNRSKIILSVVFISVVLIVVWVAISIFNSLGKKDYTSYSDLLQQQATIIHIVDISSPKLRTAATKNYVAIIRSTTTTEKAETTAFLKKVGVDTNDKKISTSVDTSNDKTITAAEQTNQYDETVTNVLNDLIADYQKNIALTAKEATTISEKALTSILLTNARVVTNVKN
jgi:hypothetical protein